MKRGKSLDYTTKPVTISGTLSINEVKDPLSGEVRAVFGMTDAVLVSPTP